MRDKERHRDIQRYTERGTEADTHRDKKTQREMHRDRERQGGQPGAGMFNFPPSFFNTCDR